VKDNQALLCVFDNCMTLTFDLLTSASMHAEQLP